MTDPLMTTGWSGSADLIVRATVVLLVALALQWLTHRGPALTRHNLWTLTFALLLVLPGLRLFGPGTCRCFPRPAGRPTCGLSCRRPQFQPMRPRLPQSLRPRSLSLPPQVGEWNPVLSGA